MLAQVGFLRRLVILLEFSIIIWVFSYHYAFSLSVVIMVIHTASSRPAIHLLPRPWLAYSCFVGGRVALRLWGDRRVRGDV